MDLIDRQAAIDAVMEFMPSLTTPDGSGPFDAEIFAAQEMFVDIGQALSDLPSAQSNTSNALESSDCISRQAAIEVADAIWSVTGDKNVAKVWDQLRGLPSAQPEQTDCEYCHEDSDGYVKPIEKNCHAFVRFGMDGWELSLKANGWHGSAKIRYCPMCGRRLKNDK